jgi:hypothetical protein
MTCSERSPFPEKPFLAMNQPNTIPLVSVRYAQGGSSRRQNALEKIKGQRIYGAGFFSFKDVNAQTW